MAERFANEPATTLVGTINGSVTSLVVASSSGFPAANFRIRIDDEIMLVTGVAGTTWTVTRAQESTTGASHTNGAAIQHILTAGGLVQALGEVIQSVIVTTGAADSHGSATFVDMASMSASITTTGGNLLAIAVGSFTHSAATTNVQVGLQADAFTTVAGPAVHSSPTVGASVLWANTHLFTGIAAGAHTVKSRWLTSGGTVTAYGGRTLLVLEVRVP